MKIHSLLATFAAAALFSVSAFAQNTVISDSSVGTAGDTTDEYGGEMFVRVNVADVCRIGSRDVDFGTIDATQTTNVTRVVDVNAMCPTGTPYTITLNPGEHGTGTGMTQRRVQGGDASGDFIDYLIYQPAADGSAASTTLWGDTADTGYDSVGTGVKQVLKATAVLNLATGGGTGTVRTPGEYNDIVVLTLTYN